MSKMSKELNKRYILNIILHTNVQDWDKETPEPLPDRIQTHELPNTRATARLQVKSKAIDELQVTHALYIARIGNVQGVSMVRNKNVTFW